MSSSDNEVPASWLDEAWHALSERSQGILSRRLHGDVLEAIGGDVGITRERVRQLQEEAENELLEAQRRHDPGLPHLLLTILGDRAAVPDAEIAQLPRSSINTARAILLRKLGVVTPGTWAGGLPGYWTRKPYDLAARLRQLAALAPMSSSETETAADDLGIPVGLPIEQLLLSPGSKLTNHRLGWIRVGRVGRDLAYLWLRDQGEPREVSEIATITGTSDHAIRETMRRDDDFAQVRPEGTWALKDWHLPGSDNHYSNAVDVVVDVLRELGALDFDQLRTESQNRYPVTAWRITQCLSSDRVGLMPDGRYNLTERGAVPIEDPEPEKPPTIQSHGNVVGIQLTVDHDVLRGSGIGVSRWLTWHLGLRTAPSTRHFTLGEGQLGEVTVKRSTSTSQLSSLRTAVLAMNLVEGCTIAVLLRTDNDTASIHHTCDHCPAAAI